METAAKRQKYPRKEATETHYIIDIFESFIQQCVVAKSLNKGLVLNIVSDPTPNENGKMSLGGLGKTHETWNLLEDFSQDKNLEVIDLSADKDLFGFLEEVVENIKRQIPDNDQVFANFEALKTRNTNVLPKTVSDLAWECFYSDLVRLGPMIKEQPSILLFFDSLDWIVDDELLKKRKTTPIHPDILDLKNVVPELDSLFFFLAKPGGLFDTLLNNSISLVITGRYPIDEIACNSKVFHNEKLVSANCITSELICEKICLGRFTFNDLERYIHAKFMQKNVKFPTNDLPDKVLHHILKISKFKPVLAVLLADLIINQYVIDSGSLTVIINKLFQTNENQANILVSDIFEQVHMLTGSYQSERILKATTLAYYRFDYEMAKNIFSFELENIFERMGKLSIIKRYPHEKTGKPLEFLRPHDDILIEFHQNYWEKVEDEEKKEWYDKINTYYKDRNAWKFSINSKAKNTKIIYSGELETIRKRQELYHLTYLFEAVRDQKHETQTEYNLKDLESACRYAQFLFIENIDQHPDHAERILSRSEVYLPFEGDVAYHNMDASRFIVWISLRRIEYWLTERTRQTEQLAIERIEKLIPFINEKVEKQYRRSLLSILDGYWGELFTWQNRLSEAKDYLDKAALEIFLEGDTNLLVWVRHLQGFIFNRQADFENSILFNTSAIETCLPGLMKKAEEYYKMIHNQDSVDEITVSKKMFFALDEDKSYSFRRMLRVFLRSLGNLAAVRRYSGDAFHSVKYSYGQIYIWHAVPHADREIARAYANLLTAMNGLELEELIKSLGIFAGKNWLLKFEKDALIKIRLIFAEALRLFKQGGMGYMHAHLPKPFISEIKKISSISERKNALKDALIKVIEGLEFKNTSVDKELENDDSSLTKKASQKKQSSLPREIADLYYLKGKIHLQTYIAGKPDFLNAKVAFKNALTVAQKAKFRYIELEALEALLNVALFEGNDQEFSNLERKLNHELSLTPQYNDIWAKFYNCLGNKMFSEVIGLYDNVANDLDLHRKIEEMAFTYMQMLDYSYRLNQDRYDIALKVIASRITDCKATELQRKVSQSLLNALQTTQAIKKDQDLHIFIVGVSRLEKLKNNAYSKDEKETVISELVTLQRKFTQKGMIRKSLEINRIIRDHYVDSIRSEFNESNATATTRAHFRVINLFQLVNQGRKAQASVKDAQEFIRYYQKHYKLKPSEITPYLSALEIANVTTKYRTNEFWVMERFLLGEEIHYRKRHKDSYLYIKELLVSIKALADSIRKSKEMRKELMRILAEGCFRLGELYILLFSKANEDKQLAKQIHEINLLTAGTLAALDPFIHKKSLVHIEQRIKENSNAFLEYARALAAGDHDIYRQADVLEGLYNYWYFKNAEEKPINDKVQLSNTIKAYTLSFHVLIRLFIEKFLQPETYDKLADSVKKRSDLILKKLPKPHFKTSKEWGDWYEKLDADDERFSLKENLASCVRFITDFDRLAFESGDYDHPFIYAKHKMVLGNEIFSKYFMPDDATYDSITRQWPKSGDKKPNLEEALFLEKCNLTDFGRKMIEEHLNQKKESGTQFGHDIRLMMRHYLEGLDVLKSPINESFEFQQYLLEIQRRFLLIPIIEPIDELLKNIEAGIYQFPRLYKDSDMLREILWTLKARYIGICLKEIYQS